MMVDRPIATAPSSYVTLTENDLFDTTDNLIREGTATQQKTARTALSKSQGWYIKLKTTPGEKGMAKSFIYAGNIYVTTYMPFDSTTGTSCQPVEGTGQLYILSILDGGGVTGDLVADRASALARAGIPPDPKMIMIDPNNTTVCVGTECTKVPTPNTHKSIYWFDR